MRLFLLFLLGALLLTEAASAHRFLGIGRPSARQRHKFAYMLNGRRMARPQSGHH